jgi:hypothetical protein
MAKGEWRRANRLPQPTTDNRQPTTNNQHHPKFHNRLHSPSVYACRIKEPAMKHLGIENLIDPLKLAEGKHVRSLMASSYDRRGGNHDWSSYVRREGTAAVLMDVEGPGCITRFWTADPQKGTVRIFIDGKIAVETPMADLFKMLPLTFGIGGESPENYARADAENLPMGHTSYCPIPFQESCKVTIDPEDDYLYYQINWHQYLPGTKIESFDPKTMLDTPAIRKVQEMWTKWEKGESPLSRHGAVTKRHVVAPGESSDVIAADGPGVVRGLWVSLPKTLDPRELEHVRENLWLISHVDDDEVRDPSMRSPIGPLFFDFGQSPKPRSIFVGTETAGDYYCFLPMPHQTSIHMKLVNKGILPVEVDTAVVHEGFDAPRPELHRLKATWHIEMPFGPDHRDYGGVACRLLNLDGRDNYEMLNVRGGGHFVGCGFQVDLRDAPTDRAAGEGDEMFFVDEDPRYTMYGTGTEDYVNDAWGMRRYVGPLSGDALMGEWGVGPQIVGYRLHVPDVVPFIRKGRFTLEHGTGNNCSGLYRSLAYWYQDPSGVRTRAEEAHWESIGKST